MSTSPRTLRRALITVLSIIGSTLFFNPLHAQQPEYPVDTNQFVNRWPSPGQAWPIRRIWGIDSNEFWLSGYVSSFSPDTTITGPSGLTNYQNWWKFWTDTTGLRIVETREKVWNGGATGFFSTVPELIDAIVRAARPKVGSVWGDRLIITPNHFDHSGSARELVFFPFDTNNSALWHSHFQQISGGALDNNGSYYSLPHGMSTERYYDTTNTTPGQVVLSNILVGYDSIAQQVEAVATLAGGNVNDSVYNGRGLTFDGGQNDNLPGSSTIFALRGHLYSELGQGGRGISVGLTDTLFFIDIYAKHLIGASYFNHVTRTTTTATSVTRFLYASVPVRKSDLLPKVPAAPDWDEYREAVKPVQLLDTNALGVRGPLHPTSSSQDFDIELRWTGKEKAAVRLLAVRDTVAQLLLSLDSTGSSTNYKQTTLRWLNRMLVGTGYASLDNAARISGDSTALKAAIAAPLASVVRAYTGDEGSMLINAGWNWCDSTLYRHYAPLNPLSTGDSVTRGFRAFRAMGRDAMVQTSENELVTEISYLYADYTVPPSVQDYFGPIFDTRAQTSYVDYGVAAPGFMAIHEHNGGSFGITEMALTPYDIARSTDLYQRRLIGWYATGASGQFYDGACRRLGQAAGVSRRTGRPLIVYQGTHTTQHIRWVYDSTIGRRVPLPLFLPTHEPSQLRLSANLGLCYGVRGLHFSYLGNNLAEFSTLVGMDTGYAGYPMYMYNYGADWGPIGPTIDRQENYLDTLVLEQGGTNPARTIIKLARASGDSVYMGWGVRMEAIRWLTKQWVPQITPELMKLRWRTSYSVCFTDSLQLVPDTNILHYVASPANYPATISSGGLRLNAEGGQHFRPIDTNEIIRSVRSYDRWGNLDSVSRTYVEVGLFDPIAGSGGYDTNHLYLVNRRTFERSNEISPASARGKTMDSLTEWRRIVLRLNLPHPDSTSYNYLRVRELNYDSTRAPWDTAPHRGLDTVVHADSLVSLWIRPGGGALLRLTYVEPGDTLHGNLTYNNGRKLMFSGNRYFAVYSLFDDVPPNNTDTTSSIDQIWLRWSQPVDSVERAVRWSGPGSGKVLVSTPAGGKPPFIQNRHPSLTVRQVGDTSRVVVTWTAHSDSTAYGNRMVLAKTLRVRNLTGLTAGVGAPAVVAYYHGSWLTPWGTPVVSTLHGAELYAWSDSMAGVIARLRVSDPTQIIYPANPWSNYDTVAKGIPCLGVPPGMFPTVPPLAHVTSLDSSVGLAWQQSRSFCAGGPGNDILYKRMIHLPGGGGTPILVDTNLTTLTPTVSEHYHPSMDLWQDVWYQCFEGVAWETLEPNVKSYVWFRPVSTETRLRGGWNPFWDSIEVSNGWAWYLQTVHTGDKPQFIWPNAAALNEVYTLATQNDTGRFAVAYLDTATLTATHDLWQVRVWYGMSSAVTDYPKKYSFDGDHPAISSSPIRQDLRAATLYESDHDANQGNAIVNPTHQFFSRMVRPRGYLALGREMMLLDTLRTGAVARLGEVWVSDEDSSWALGMTQRASTRARIDTLEGALALARSASFTTHDSAEIGLHAEARFTGDSAHAAARGMAIHLRWELMEASSGTAVALLDSTTISAAHSRHDSLVSRVLDLVSGTYHVRMTADTVGLTPRPLGGEESRWPVAEAAVWIESLSAKAVRTGEASGSRARLGVQPNPAADRTEVMVSVPEGGEVHVNLYTVEGARVGVIYEGFLERGRYSVPCSVGNLPAGSYLVELVAGRTRLTQQLIVLQ